ncbi:MAG: sodium-dependent transporter [Gammaproteobacteria bacterium]|nr:sodium-dependent transporter [Gammaproteobacteria bacterium]NNM01929.1 sodium-dependent transporter [Gammaproteobacteria bacterium]
MVSGVQRASWSSGRRFALAAIGGAVGLGNIWKFPYVAGTNGGSAFVVVYLAAVFSVAIPILIAELMLGRNGHASPPEAMRVNAAAARRSRHWALLGWLGVLTGFLILSFYSVIGGWVIDYLATSMAARAGVDPAAAAERFDALLASPWRMLAGHSAFAAATAFIISRGLTEGIERATGVLMPVLFALLVVLAGYASIAGDFGSALRFMFDADFSKIDADVGITAVGQAFFSIGVSMGLMMAYGAYLPEDVSLPRTAVAIAMADTLVALLAGFIIFPLVFANGLAPGEGPGLIFVTLPIAFAAMPGGGLFAVLFFAALLAAALTSSIALLEPVVAWVEEHRGITRPRAAALLGGGVWALGILSVLSFNTLADFHPLAALTDRNLFDLMDYLTANIMMPVGGMLIAVFVGWFVSGESVSAALDWRGATCTGWRWLLRTLVPVVIAVLLISGL